MDDLGLELSFPTITEAHVPELTDVMKRAFDDDAQKHLGKEQGGPDGYDDGSFFSTWLFGFKETDGYQIVCADRIIGAIIVWILPDGHNVLGTIFVDPLFQDRGVGRRTWRMIEERYPETKSWRLATPPWATKNHHFYAVTCGFTQVDSDPIIGEVDDVLIFRKQIQPAS